VSAGLGAEPRQTGHTGSDPASAGGGAAGDVALEEAVAMAEDKMKVLSGLRRLLGLRAGRSRLV
jgi:hypothetical protein